MTPYNKNTSRGFTLIEIIVTIVFISIAMVGVLTAYTQAMKTSSDPLQQIRAVELGQAYIDEIINKKFDEKSAQGGIPRCGSTDTGQVACTTSGNFGPDLHPITGVTETRAIFNDVDDFTGIDETPPKDPLGVDRFGYDSYRAQISVVHAGTELTGLNNVDAKRIDIIITTPKGDDFSFSAYRVNF
jgi:MSHA pilin protein MshD